MAILIPHHPHTTSMMIKDHKFPNNSKNNSTMCLPSKYTLNQPGFWVGD